MSQIAEVFIKVETLAESLGIKDINKIEGLWKHNIDATWSVWVNGHNETIDRVDPYTCIIRHNGLPVGIFNPTSGAIMDLYENTEDVFIAAIDKAIGQQALKRGLVNDKA